MLIQFYDVAGTFLYCAIGTFIILKVIDAVVGLRVKREVEIEGLRAYASVRDVPGSIDMASFYVPPEIGLRVIEDVAAKQIPEVWLNPGAESDELIARARALQIKPIVACSIIGIGQNPYDV